MKNKILLLIIPLLLLGISSCNTNQKDKNKQEKTKETTSNSEIAVETAPLFVDSLAYFNKLEILANGDTTGKWPILDQPLPLSNAFLPNNRIVAFYGNLYSKRMGALGEYAPKEMWQMLNEELEKWEKADPATPVVPALHYIAVVAQGDAGKDGMYRFRMPFAQIDSVLRIAEMHENTQVFLDIQVGLSKIQNELPLLEEYLKMPHVHLGIDPEFSMKDGSKPGKRIGTFDAAEINYCSNYLSELVKEHNLPPKMFVVHRFTQGMLTNYKNIELHPEVQIIIDMDGWGAPYLKFSTHNRYIYKEPIQFTGFKIFYKNDIKNPPHKLLTPEELLTLIPQPSYIQYQ